MRCFFALLLLSFALEASEASRREYLELVRQYPRVVEPRGKATAGEIEIVLDEERMASIEQRVGRDVGVVARDKYWIWINDACRFPNGQEGVYGRLLWVKTMGSVAGVAVMPVMPDGKIVLNCIFRHATRSWEIELPRGATDPGENAEAAAKRETLEETGMVIDSLTLLGEMPPDSGMANTVVPIFMAKVLKQQEAQREDAEAIENILTLSLDEIKKSFAKGFYCCKMRGEEKHVLCRDPFLAYAVLLLECGEKNVASECQR